MDSSTTPATSPNALHSQVLVGNTPPHTYYIGGCSYGYSCVRQRAMALLVVQQTPHLTCRQLPLLLHASNFHLVSAPPIRTHHDCHGEMLTFLPAGHDTQLTTAALQSLQSTFKLQQSAMMERYLRQERWEEPRPGVSK